jgi:hypothetical protein
VKREGSCRFVNKLKIVVGEIQKKKKKIETKNVPKILKYRREKEKGA